MTQLLQCLLNLPLRTKSVWSMWDPCAPRVLSTQIGTVAPCPAPTPTVLRPRDLQCLWERQPGPRHPLELESHFRSRMNPGQGPRTCLGMVGGRWELWEHLGELWSSRASDCQAQAPAARSSCPVVPIRGRGAIGPHFWSIFIRAMQLLKDRLPGRPHDPHPTREFIQRGWIRGPQGAPWGARPSQGLDARERRPAHCSWWGPSGPWWLSPLPSMREQAPVLHQKSRILPKPTSPATVPGVRCELSLGGTWPRGLVCGT